MRIAAADRAGRERLLRYCVRPPFALQRLRELDCEHLIYDHPKPGPGSSGPQLLTPLELLDRLATLVPPPRIHRHRYFGALTPNAPLRAAVTALALAAATVPAAARRVHGSARGSLVRGPKTAPRRCATLLLPVGQVASSGDNLIRWRLVGLDFLSVEAPGQSKPEFASATTHRSSSGCGNIPKRSNTRPFAERSARLSARAEIGAVSTASSKYISLTIRK